MQEDGVYRHLGLCSISIVEVSRKICGQIERSFPIEATYAVFAMKAVSANVGTLPLHSNRATLLRYGLNPALTSPDFSGTRCSNKESGKKDHLKRATLVTRCTTNTTSTHTLSL
jgi:hypothetical protein